ERGHTSRIILSLMTDLLEEFDSIFEVFGIEKISESTNTRKRRKIHPEYILFGNSSTKLDIIIELRKLKDMLGNLRDVLHFKKEDIESIFTVGIQMVTFIVPKTLPEMNNLLIDFIKGLLGLRHTLLWLDNKLIQLTKRKYSTPSPVSSPPPETSKTPEVKRAKN
ncbi:5430_t:CDS:2, partial [Entrophospora sp. SA101]